MLTICRCLVKPISIKMVMQMNKIFIIWNKKIILSYTSVHLKFSSKLCCGMLYHHMVIGFFLRMDLRLRYGCLVKMLVNFVMTKLHTLPQIIANAFCWWQTNLTHSTSIKGSCIQVFGNCIISRNGTISWPPRYPDFCSRGYRRAECTAVDYYDTKPR